MAAQFKSIRVQGYRRLVDVEVTMDCRPLTVLIGANGVGKTSFLEVWCLLAASSQGRLEKTLNDWGGLNAVLTHDGRDSLSVELAMDVPNYEPLDYQLTLALRGQGYTIAQETLSQRNSGFRQPFKHIESVGANIQYYEMEGKRLVRPTWEHNPVETSLAQVPKMFNQPEALRALLASSTRYGPLDVSPRSPVRLPQPLRPATLPGADGEELVSLLYSLRETEPDRFELIEDTLKAAFPDFKGLQFPPVAAGTLAMTWRDKNFSRPMYMHQLSEGTLRFLWLTALLLSPSLPAITLIDEPEISLHPDLLRLLVDVMRQASWTTQLIVATHSDRLIRFLEPSEVLVVDSEDGESQMTWADEMDLERWLQEYSLDQLWAMGRLGGRE